MGENSTFARVAAGVGDRGDGLLEHLRPRLAELVLEVDVRRRDERVDPGMGRPGHRLPGAVDIGGIRPGERRDLAARISRAICRTDAKSPSEATGKPASMISTPIFSSWRAIRSFSSGFMLAPGDCSPSLSVVSNIKTLSPVASIADSFHQK